MLPKVRSDHLLVTHVGEELVLFDQRRDKAHRLNPTAAALWRMADGETSVEELARGMARELGIPSDEDLVWVTLDRLAEAGLLAETGERPPLTRRSAMKYMAGLTVALLPVVTSIAAPTPAMAQSGGGSGTTGSDPCINPVTGETLCKEPEPEEEPEPEPEPEPEKEPEPEEKEY